MAGESKYSIRKLFDVSPSIPSSAFLICLLKLGIFAGVLFRGSLGLASDDIHPAHPAGSSQRLCYHRGADLLYVCHDVHLLIGIIGEYIAILVYGAEGQAGVYCEGDEEY